MESKIQRILGDPEAMSRMLNIAKSLGLSGSPSVPSQTEAPEERQEAPPEPEYAPDEGSSGRGGSGSEGIFDLLGDMDPAMIGKVMGLLGEYSRTDDRRVIFLRALKPYLRSERADRIDRVSQMVRIARTASKALGSWNEK
jgi:hypothetical protein